MLRSKNLESALAKEAVSPEVRKAVMERYDGFTNLVLRKGSLGKARRSLKAKERQDKRREKKILLRAHKEIHKTSYLINEGLAVYPPQVAALAAPKRRKRRKQVARALATKSHEDVGASAKAERKIRREARRAGRLARRI